MVLEGKIDERNQLWVTVTVGGRQKKQTVTSIVDTGFNGGGLLHDYILLADFAAKKFVIKEPK